MGRHRLLCGLLPRPYILHWLRTTSPKLLPWGASASWPFWAKPGGILEDTGAFASYCSRLLLQALSVCCWLWPCRWERRLKRNLLACRVHRSPPPSPIAAQH